MEAVEVPLPTSKTKTISFRNGIVYIPSTFLPGK
jgi:hypothetical protein